MILGLCAFLGLAILAFWYGKKICIVKGTGRGMAYGVGIVYLMCAIVIIKEMIKTGFF